MDTEILEAVVRLGFNRSDVEHAVRNRVQNKDSVAYYLLLDNRKQLGHDAAYLQHDIEEASLLFPSGMPSGVRIGVWVCIGGLNWPKRCICATRGGRFMPLFAWHGSQ